MTRVHLLRHAMPTLDPRVSPREWPLSPEGRIAATALRSRLPADAARLSSDEAKAMETLELAVGGPFTVDARFAEVHRPRESIATEALSARRAWIAGALDARHEGWETARAAAERFHTALNEYVTDDVVVATHGMVLTAWLVSIGTVEAGEPAARFWDSLKLPDLILAEPW